MTENKFDPLHDAVAQRREVLRKNPHAPNEQAIPVLEDDDPVWGLALSGGGIRSATFCLGVIRSLAANGMLLRFDLLSTVSGGGYIGGMLGRLFDHARKCGDASKVNEALAQAEKTNFGWWLRANGRYLSPSGWADTLFAVTLYLRNILGIHIEFGIIAMLLALGMCAANLVIWQSLSALGANFPDLLEYLLWLQPWVPTPWVIALLFLPFAVHYVFAYWQLRWAKKDGILERLQGVIAIAVTTAIPLIVLLCLRQFQLIVISDGNWIAIACMGSLLFLTLTASAKAHRVFKALGSEAEARNALTHSLYRCLYLFLALIAFGVIDRLGWLIAFESTATLNLGLLLGAAAVGLRGLVPLLSTRGQSTTAWMGRSGSWLLQGLGYLLTFCLLVWWTALAISLVMDPVFVRTAVGAAGEPRQFLDPRYGIGWMNWLMVVAPVGAYALLTGRNVDFLNLSSLHKFYAARLTRAYLGAANGKRFGDQVAAISRINVNSGAVNGEYLVGKVHVEDDAALREYQPHLAGGPVHIINVCVNQSSAAGGNSYNQDRKGLLLSVLSGGMTRLSQQQWEQNSPLGNMSLGTWLAISGAAVAPGLGSRTQKGLAALLTFAGVRLGYWVTREERGEVCSARPFWEVHLGKSLGLISEISGTFSAADDSNWLLSDGGHFENTGAYALLAARAQFILVADCGADPSYSFSDLENLVRKARIDLGTEIEFQRPVACPSAWSDRLSYFGSLNDLASSDGCACLALATIQYPESAASSGHRTGILVVIKPNMCRGLPMDIENFRQRYPLFPQQPTSDQFFSEEQWESYFSLGSFLADKLSSSFSKAIIESPHLYFEPDDLATLGESGVRGRSDDRDTKSLVSRLPQRIGSAAVGATLGAGAVATVAISVWQAAEGFRASMGTRVAGERAAMKELVDLWAKLPTLETAMGPPTPATAQDRQAATTLAAAVVRAADGLCENNEARWLQDSKLGRKIVRDVTLECGRQSYDRSHACTVLLASGNGPTPSLYSTCLTPQVEYPVPAYWGYDYSQAATWARMHPCSPRRDAMVLANESFLERDFGNTGGVPEHLWANPSISKSELANIREGVCPKPLIASPDAKTTPSPPPPQQSTSASAPIEPPKNPASAALPTGEPVSSNPPKEQQLPWQNASTVCKAITIYIQIYGPEDRNSARYLRDWWRKWGANVPPIEDVNDSARRAGRANPALVRQTQFRYHDAQAKACADEIVKEAMQIKDIKGFEARNEPGALPAVVPLGFGLKSTRGVVEFWLRPGDAAWKGVSDRIQATPK
jgi:hypothetical protein